MLILEFVEIFPDLLPDHFRIYIIVAVWAALCPLFNPWVITVPTIRTAFVSANVCPGDYVVCRPSTSVELRPP